MVAIYKITSPNGSVYIGQSFDVSRRFRQYNRTNCKSQERVHHSFEKYGVNNHTFSILQELPIDVDIKTINEYEYFYWQQHKDCGFDLMNLRIPGDNKRLTKEHKDKIGIGNRKKKPSTGAKVSVALKGRKLSMEVRNKIRAAKIGKPHPIVNTENMHQWKMGKKMSEEAKEKMSKAKKGKFIPWNKGKKTGPPWNKGITGYSTSWKGRHHPQEGKDKIRDKLKLAWAEGKFENRNILL